MNFTLKPEYHLLMRTYVLPVLLAGAFLSEINLTLVNGYVPVRLSVGDMIILASVLGYVFFSWTGLKKVVAGNPVPVTLGLAFILVSMATGCIGGEYWLVSLKFCIKGCILFFLLVVIFQDSLVSKGTITALLAMMVFVNVVGILEYFYSGQMRGFLLLFKSEASLVPSLPWRVSSIFPNTNTYGVFNAVFIVMALGLILHHRRLVNRYLCWVSLPLCLVGLFLTSSRNGVLTVVAGTSLIGASLIRSRKGAWRALLVASCALAILVAAFSVYEPMARRFVDLVSLGSNALEGRSFGVEEVSSAIDLEDRLVIWKNGWALFMEEPVFGIGASQFLMRNSHPGGKDINMHNIFGDVLVNHGVVGFSLFIALLAIWFKKAKGAWQAGLIATLLVSHLFDCFAPYSMIWLVFVAWLVALTTRRPVVMFVKSGSLQPAMSDPGRTDERSVIGQ